MALPLELPPMFDVMTDDLAIHSVDAQGPIFLSSLIANGARAAASSGRRFILDAPRSSHVTHALRAFIRNGQATVQLRADNESPFIRDEAQACGHEEVEIMATAESADDIQQARLHVIHHAGVALGVRWAAWGTAEPVTEPLDVASLRAFLDEQQPVVVICHGKTSTGRPARIISIVLDAQRVFTSVDVMHENHPTSEMQTATSRYFQEKIPDQRVRSVWYPLEGQGWPLHEIRGSHILWQVPEVEDVTSS